MYAKYQEVQKKLALVKKDGSEKQLLSEYEKVCREFIGTKDVENFTTDGKWCNQLKAIWSSAKDSSGEKFEVQVLLVKATVDQLLLFNTNLDAGLSAADAAKLHAIVPNKILYSAIMTNALMKHASLNDVSPQSMALAVANLAVYRRYVRLAPEHREAFIKSREWMPHKIFQLVVKQADKVGEIKPENANFFAKMVAEQVAKSNCSDPEIKRVINSCFGAGFSTFNPTPKEGEDLHEVYRAVKKTFK